MAKDAEPILTNPSTHDVARHVHDYARFTAMVKWGAVISFIIGIIVVFFVIS